MKKLIYPRLWIDIETTGLNHENDNILEFAYALQVHSDTALSFESVQVSHGTYRLNENTCGMHLNNNLINDCLHKGLPFKVAFDQLAEDLQNVVKLVNYSPIQVAGASPHFDLKCLTSSHMMGSANSKFFKQYLHHRVFDVSSLISFAQEKGFKLKKYNSDHRALGDIENTYETYLELLKRLKL